MSVPALAALEPSVASAHASLGVAEPEVALPARLLELTDESAGCDGVHDNTIRGTHTYLGALATLATHAAEATELLALRAFLLPDGLLAVQKTYRGEAGEAALLRQRLAEQPEKAARLATLAVPVGAGTTVGALVDLWTSKAARLGELDDERAALVAAASLPGAAASPSRQELRNARYTWIQQVNALLAIATAIKLPAEAHQAIFGHLEAALAIAERRGNGPKGGR